MNLLMITQKIDLDDHNLGFAHQWAKKLAQRVSKLHILARYIGRHDLPHNVTLYSMGAETGKGKLRRRLTAVAVIAKLCRKAQIEGIFAHQCPEFVIAASPFAKLANKPIVLFYAHKAVSWQLRLGNLLAGRIVTSTEEGFRLDSPKKLVVGQGIDTNLFYPGEPRYARQNTRQRVLSVGRISPIKKYEILIEAANILVHEYALNSSIEFQVVGDVGRESQKNYLTRLQELVYKYNLSSNFHFLGPVPNHELPRFYEECDIFVNLSNTDSLDKAVLEAMACERLVITSNAAFKPILTPIDKRLLVDKSDCKGLANRIFTLLHMDGGEQERLAGILRKIIVENHNLDAFMDKLVECFVDLSDKRT